MDKTPLSESEIDQIVELVKLLGEDCLTIAPQDLQERLGLDAKGTAEHLKTYFIHHDPRRVLRGEESIGAAVLLLYQPPCQPYPGGGIWLFSSRPEHTEQYRKFKSELPDKIQ